ncbi:hypothetical protein E2C01_034378 [Portunus trituberculatus]|uniref:Uncharacterized protein n=1 Tax=Portunus trituberculatus TaxID=210409 RepID=A0A5B7F0I2_PORTR|nr:hypothetical protein [Portunus trituberculatus]
MLLKNYPKHNHQHFNEFAINKEENQAQEALTIREVHPVHGLLMRLLTGYVGERYMPPVANGGIQRLIRICDILLTNHKACLGSQDMTILKRILHNIAVNSDLPAPESVPVEV